MSVGRRRIQAPFSPLDYISLPLCCIIYMPCLTLRCIVSTARDAPLFLQVSRVPHLSLHDAASLPTLRTMAASGQVFRCRYDLRPTRVSPHVHAAQLSSRPSHKAPTVRRRGSRLCRRPTTSCLVERASHDPMHLESWPDSGFATCGAIIHWCTLWIRRGVMTRLERPILLRGSHAGRTAAGEARRPRNGLGGRVFAPQAARSSPSPHTRDARRRV